MPREPGPEECPLCGHDISMPGDHLPYHIRVECPVAIAYRQRVLDDDVREARNRRSERAGAAVPTPVARGG